MTIIKKTAVYLMCFCSMPALASSTNTSLYEKIYQLSAKLWYVETSLNEEQKRMVDTLANQIDMIITLPNEASCGTQLEVFQEANKWAYSSNGLDLTASEAEQFAGQVSQKFCPAAYLKVFKSSFEFAYKSTGLDKTRSEARKFATTMSDYEASKYYSKNSLQCFIDNYNYAYSSSGMNKTRAEAINFANQQCLI